MFSFLEKDDLDSYKETKLDYINNLDDFDLLESSSPTFRLYNLDPFERGEDIIEGKIKEDFFNNENTKNFKKEVINFVLEKTGYTSLKKNYININLNNNIQNNEYKINEKDAKSSFLEFKKILGRKKKYSNEFAKHNKFSDDILSKKCKHVIISNIIKFINNLIKKKYKVFDHKYQLLRISQRQIIITKVDYNRNFLYKKLKDILSDEISCKYKRFLYDHNKILIQRLLNEEDEEKRTLFQKIFNFTFLDCLNHFIGKVKIKELEGFIGIDEVCKEFNDEKDYEDYKGIFKNFVLNYERIINEKKVRNRSKKVDKLKD